MARMEQYFKDKYQDTLTNRVHFLGVPFNKQGEPIEPRLHDFGYFSSYVWHYKCLHPNEPLTLRKLHMYCIERNHKAITDGNRRITDRRRK